MSQLTNRILQEVKSTRPYPKAYFQLLLIAIILVVLFLVTTTIIGITFNFWDMSRFLSVRPRRQLVTTIWQFLGILVLESLLLLGVTTVILVVIYKKTDLLFHRSKKWLIGTLIAMILTVSVATWLVIERHPPTQRYFDRLEKRLQRRQRFLVNKNPSQ
jgi:hypothetical protein